MGIKTKEELLAALRLGQIQAETWDEVVIGRSYIENNNQRGDICRNVSVYNLSFAVVNNVNIRPERVRIRKIKRRS